MASYNRVIARNARQRCLGISKAEKHTGACGSTLPQSVSVFFFSRTIKLGASSPAQPHRRVYQDLEGQLSEQGHGVEELATRTQQLVEENEQASRLSLYES